MKKKVKKTKKAVAKKSGTKKVIKAGKPIGAVTHFYGKIKVAIVKFKKPMKVGAEIAFRGAHTDFTQKIASMQFDHEPVSVAKKGQQVGIKVSKKVHEGDSVYEA